MRLYVHVPFCRAKCAYCGFFSKPMDMGLLEDFVSALCREIRYYAKIHPRAVIETLYFGGGTPSLLPPWALSRIMKELHKAFRFGPGLEFTFEVNPDSALDGAYLRQLLGYGVGRLSIGVQSLDDEMLFLLGRPHDAATARAAYFAARQAGFANIGLDFLWGLPGQRLSQWLATLKAAVRLSPEHLSCYGLTLEPGTPLTARIESGELSQPPEAEQAEMFVRGAQFLESEGYLHYEISNFARMGFVSRHNSGYWEGRDYLGLGPSAVSTMDGRRFENPRDIGGYVALSRKGRFGGDAKELSPDELVREMVMLSLRTTKGLDLAAYRARAGRDFLKDNAGLVQALRQNELVRLSAGHLRLTKNGLLVSNVILARLSYGMAAGSGGSGGRQE
ncbi:radical SAM family heme chaperone HemW [Desulfovibrio sulfodismutans]|uniref:Heme chaperone HemW n=1 Tax=Desulfolutivibrio sulfodismutans TaxID=63561 RepID=A0A7K3NKT1_9BACT|nr:radical SAM family heme chaperone HemW [Desulfolutivibrio sulfodismutans]NDY56801.1 radical SAM family heme chaperone HemW [Desulfolutivibrio sulfodismutans]QLA14359.1 radical SAM family heme chaperone HemW [Desulfolutivibrio sulfodismutans DSM 3696]